MRELPVQSAPVPPTRLRAHTLLCLQGFRGKGYSPAFIDNMETIHHGLAQDPDRVVELAVGPDVICGACPHHAGGGCTLNGVDSEAAMQVQDDEVLHRLGWHVGERYSWRTILDRIGATIRPEDLSDICGSCRWLALGYCREGVARLAPRGGRR